MFWIFVSFLLVTRTHTLKSGENIAEILLSNGISKKSTAQVVSALGKKINLRKCKPGDKLYITTRPASQPSGREGKFIELKYEQPHATWVVDSLNNVSKLKERKVLIYLKGTIEKGSLWDALLSIGGTPKLVYEFAETVFPWDIDFNVETRNGDKFEIFTTARYIENRFIGYGKILFATYLPKEWQKNKKYTGIYYPKGRHGYYSLDGKSLQRLFLKAPLSYVRVSSRFSYSRFHPILRIRRPHLGVDYAAPTGTPIRTIGDGKVTFVGWRKGFGRQVIIRHSRGFKSYYGHLSRFRKGIKKGKYVKQGKVIGYVGSTGLSTGPHLDFRLKKHGKWINPLKLNPPSIKPLKGKELQRYKEYKKELFTLMSGIKTLKKILPLSAYFIK